MDAFVTRQKKRKRRTPSPPPVGHSSTTTRTPGKSAASNEWHSSALEEDSTEVKLAMLASLVDDGSDNTDQHMLLDLLLAHDGSVALASAAFQSHRETWAKKTKLRRGSGAIGLQTSLRSLFPSPDPRSSLSPEKKGPATTLLSKRGRTLFLYDPVDIGAHTPCTLVHNFLPAEAANDLLREMMAEAASFDTPHTFKLFEQVVSSPHTSCLYLEPGTVSAAAKAKMAPRRDAAKPGHAEPDPFVLNSDTHDGYRYNGSRLSDIRTVTPHMESVRTLVQDAVNKAVQERIATHYPGARKLKHQNSQPWKPNAAFVNCYNGGAESVGWHSDHLTYLGPRAVIGSLSLGVAREFRVRRIVPRDHSTDDASSSASIMRKPAKEDDAAGQISIHLPHNSLLIMHAEMQEEWKHSVSPAASIDPHPVSGRKRINITYRDYRAEFRPELTPRCRCNIAAILRVVQRKQENHGRYFWMCHAGNMPGRQGCTYFQWAEFDDDGRPLRRAGDKAAGQQGQTGAADNMRVLIEEQKAKQ